MSLYFTKDHEWIRVEGEEGVVGITAYAAEKLGDVIAVELPDVGKAVSQGKEAGAVDSVKAASEIFAPASGEVTAINEALDASPELVNQDPGGEGWFFKLKLKDPAEVAALMDQAAYDAYLASLD